MDTENSLLATNAIDVENEDQIEYACHVHPFMLCDMDDNKGIYILCCICDERCFGRGRTYYGCNECGLFLHESCAKIKISQEIHHYFHPHPLRLAMKESYKHSYKRCYACLHILPGFLFECRDCEFYMDVECALLPTKLKQDGCIDHMQHFIHPHPLILCEIDKDCSICGESCLGQRTYGCNQCGLFLYESCTKIETPQEIHHYFHPHTLRLTINRPRHCCSACNDSLPSLMFECRDCRFYMDVECALLPTKLKQDGCTIDHILHFKHPHPLILCDDEKKYENKLCNGCAGPLSTRPCFSCDDTSLLSEGSESIYGCLRCEFFLHQRCARLPLEIESPFHPGHHPLTLIWSSDQYPTCQGCCRPIVTRYTYERFKFILGVECGFLRAPILKLDNGEYLTLMPSVNPVLTCRVCKKKCDSSNIFRCVKHDYNLHLHCGPLPCSIKDKCHIDSYGDPHPLKLMDAFVEDGYEDDYVYCDVCEQPRDPDECVYYCKDCNFFAELKCVEDEVLASLKGERGTVKLRTANKTRIRVGAKLIDCVTTDNVETNSSDSETEHIGAKYLEVEEVDENFLSGCYTDEECEQLIEIFKKARVQLLPSTSFLQERNKALCVHIERCEVALAELQSKGKQEFKTSIFCYSLDEESDNGENAITGLLSSDFKQLMRNLDSYYEQDELLEVFFRRGCKIVRIGEHKIIQDSASLLKGLLLKYGDFTTRSKISERLKAIFLTMFCEVIRNMCLTNVREVEDGVLHKWWKALKLAQHAGFEIQFAIDQLYKVVEASFGMQAITSHREMKSQVEKISNELEEKEAKLEAMRRELEAEKRELEELKSRVNEHKYAIEYQTSPVIKKCLKQVSELKWKKAWDGSPIMFR